MITSELTSTNQMDAAIQAVHQLNNIGLLK